MPDLHFAPRHFQIPALWLTLVEVQSLQAVAPALRVVSSARAGTVTGTWEWIAPDGTTVRDRSEVTLDRTVVVALPARTRPSRTGVVVHDGPAAHENLARFAPSA